MMFVLIFCYFFLLYPLYVTCPVTLPGISLPDCSYESRKKNKVRKRTSAPHPLNHEGSTAGLCAPSTVAQRHLPYVRVRILAERSSYMIFRSQNT